MTEILTRRWTRLAPGAFVLGLALLTTGCASNSSNVANPDVYDTYDTNHDNNLTQGEWDQGYMMMDTNGDGIVTRDEFDAAMGGRGR